LKQRLVPGRVRFFDAAGRGFPAAAVAIPLRWRRLGPEQGE
jgi:hypothetical protein